MTVSLEVVQKELVKVEKKRKATETLKKEAHDSLEKLKQTELGLQYQEIAIRSLTVPPAGRTAAAQQLAAVMNIPYNEPTIMELVNRYEKQDVVDEISVVPEPKTAEPTAVKPAPVKPQAVQVDTEGDDPVATTAKRRGRPTMTPEQKAEAARQRAMAAQVKANAATAAEVTTAPAHIAEEPVDEDDDEYFDSSDYEE